MKTTVSRIVTIFLIFLFSSSFLYSQDIPARPEPPKLVNDLAGILSVEEVQQLESKLVAFNDSTSTQLVVVIVKSLNGYDKNEFAYRIGESWGVGQKGKNNGAVILVKPKSANENGEVSIQTGYGVEGAIPDALAIRIVDNEMIPRFKEGNYYQGIDAATSTMISLLKGEFTADQYKKRTKDKSNPVALIIPLIILVIVFTMIRGSRYQAHSVGKHIPFWTALWMLGSMGGGSRGNWHDFSSGSGGFGGGGGGFGGFGGGSFGGGGAGGSW
ncbi:MAG: TPM domain-containing protein [Bacteroidales bacterium]|nr:TPM domain-containing protein [Bacteroidales bacterium]